MNNEKMNPNNTARKVATLGMMVALAMILSYIESIIILPIGIPGIKVGLSNLLVVILLYTYGWREALLVNFTRILLSGLLFGTGMSLVFSLVGGCLSFLVMALFYNRKLLTVTGISILGGVFHNTGQLIAAVFFFSVKAPFFYLPALILCGVLTGALNGILATAVLTQLEKFPTDLKRSARMRTDSDNK